MKREKVKINLHAYSTNRNYTNNNHFRRKVHLRFVGKPHFTIWVGVYQFFDISKMKKVESICVKQNYETESKNLIIWYWAFISNYKQTFRFKHSPAHIHWLSFNWLYSLIFNHSSAINLVHTYLIVTFILCEILSLKPQSTPHHFAIDHIQLSESLNNNHKTINPLQTLKSTKST